MEKIKAVRIMCDWCADGVWSAPSIPDSTMDGFRVSLGLWRRIHDWQDWYERHNPRLDLHGDPDFDLHGFVAEGYAVARAVKAESPDWIVLYKDELLYAESLRHPEKNMASLVEIPSAEWQS